MKTNKINCHQLTKSIFEKFINDTKKILMLIFFVGFSTTGAFAQNSCLVTGYSASPPFPTAVIESCASGSNLIYLASPSIASTFIWSLSLNTSGASIVGTDTANSVEVNPGTLGGSFFITCTVTGIANPDEVNFCGVSVAVYQPTVTGVPATICGPGEVTLGATGLSNHSVAVWYADASGGSPLFTGTSFTTSVTSTTSFWVSDVVTTPFLGLVCDGPRIEVVATVNPPATATANDDQTICAGSTVQLAGSIGGGASSGTWSTSGTGSFAPNAGTLNAVYTPSLADVTAGTVTLTLTTNDPDGPCPEVHDDMVVTINPPSTATANDDQTICAGSTVQLAGSIGGSASSGTWSTSGTGSFAPNAGTLNAVYTPSVADETAGTVTLTLTTNDPDGPCPAVHDDMVVTFISCAIEGCTLGYWKNHTDRWCTNYTPCMKFGDVFDNEPASFTNLTLLEALNLRGGGVYNLARQGVAALLNACSDEVDYPAPYLNNPQSVINPVNQAFKDGGKVPGELASKLDILNNSGCPLGGTRATTLANCDSKTSNVSFEAYPVPFKNQLTIKYKFDYSSDVKIELIDYQGVTVFSENDSNSYLDKEVSLSFKFKREKEQVYFVRVTTNQGSTIKKVLSSSK
jgi:hypothetical protein